MHADEAIPGVDGRHVWLTGISGAGKSTVAPLLGQSLGRACADTDGWIVASTGRSVAEIFDRDGEAAFRALESRAVATLADGPALVIALGGGALLSAENRERIIASGILVHLDADPQTLAARLARGEVRPLLGTADHRQMADRLARLRADREPVYGMARFAVVTDDRTPVAVAEAVLAGLRANGQHRHRVA